MAVNDQDNFDELRGMDGDFQRQEIGGGGAMREKNPDGIYGVTVRQAILKRTPKDKQYLPVLELSTEITEGPATTVGGPLTIGRVIKENTLWKLKEDFQTMKIQILPSQIKANLPRFRGMKLRVKLYGGNDGKQYQDILARLPDGGPAPGQPPATAFTEEEVPF